MKRIAVVEDEVYMREELCNMLQKDGYLAEAITEFEDAARLLAALRPDLVILDLNLPEISGFQICQELKNKTAIPVLVLTSRDQVKDELQAFHLGADEYLTKPCRKDRLLARVSNILKRYEGRTNLIEGPDFLLDQQTYTLYIHNTSVVLPKNQGKLLVALLSGGDALVTTEQLCIALHGDVQPSPERQQSFPESQGAALHDALPPRRVELHHAGAGCDLQGGRGRHRENAQGAGAGGLHHPPSASRQGRTHFRHGVHHLREAPTAPSTGYDFTRYGKPVSGYHKGG